MAAKPQRTRRKTQRFLKAQSTENAMRKCRIFLWGQQRFWLTLKEEQFLNQVIEQELISDIIELTIEGEVYENQIQRQLNLLTEKEFEYTGVGLYVYFQSEPEIEKYKLSKAQLNEMFGQYNHELTRFELINTELNILADVTVHFSDGIIECVEIRNKPGSYPEGELLTYELRAIGN